MARIEREKIYNSENIDAKATKNQIKPAYRRSSTKNISRSDETNYKRNYPKIQTLIIKSKEI